jgi:tetratricopeptide (TPR) repeat protein
MMETGRSALWTQGEADSLADLTFTNFMVKTCRITDLLLKKEYKKAIASVETSLEMDPRLISTPTRNFMYCGLALAYMAVGRLVKASQYLDKSLELAGQDRNYTFLACFRKYFQVLFLMPKLASRHSRTIREIKARCRWCVVVSHGGEEFTALPSPYTRERYLQYLDMGADLVVCHHPHVPMNYELVGEKAIFYSLGNFIFDTPYQRSQYHTEEGVVLKLCFTPENYSFEACGIRILRGEERVVKGELPVIFRNVPAQEYELLAPLAAKMFIAATKRQQIYMNPARFSDATDEAWREHFLEPKRSGRVPGEALDFYILLPLAAEEEKQAWRRSSLDDVKEYILQQM